MPGSASRAVRQVDSSTIDIRIETFLAFAVPGPRAVQAQPMTWNPSRPHHAADRAHAGFFNNPLGDFSRRVFFGMKASLHAGCGAARLRAAHETRRRSLAKGDCESIGFHSLRNRARLRLQPDGRTLSSTSGATTAQSRERNVSAAGQLGVAVKSSKNRLQVHTPFIPNRCFCRQCSTNAAPPSTRMTRLKL